MKTPSVSVVIGVYNGATHLEETLTSILVDQGCDLEIVAVDDGSTDCTGDILRARAATDSRLRIISQPNAGLTQALIRGCAEARGEFIARQDVGDVSRPGRLAAQTALLRQQPGLAFVDCGHVLMGPAGEPLVKPQVPPHNGRRGPSTPGSGDVPAPCHGTVMFRKSAYSRAGGYRGEFYFAQDVDLWSRLIEQGEFGSVPDLLYDIRFDLDSITARHRREQQALRALAAQARALRQSGGSDADVLCQAATIRPVRTRNLRPAAHRAAAAYFVGSCLVQQRDLRARNYLLQALRANPLHLKSWFKLLESIVLTGGPSA